ncbi:MAG TPA: ASPIC/UnbV domain-containing protein, partial [Capsulimonadaceae bacterium]|nr:ASPIC/UnbV domain-containing protein [Capsulimonadaceae bacterium]
PDLSRPILGRGVAVGDFDNDGRMDALVVDSSGAPLLLHNETAGAGHWLTLNLVGTKSNRDGFGALVTADTGMQTITRLCHADGSYLSASDKRVHLGLGAATTVKTLTIRWPSGQTDVYKDVPADQIATAVEGAHSFTKYPSER